jgi:NIMA (never in mitosis gene a)-related kinase
MELCRGGELFEYLSHHGAKGLSEVQAAKHVRDMLSAITYLHENNIMHRDLKSANVFLNKDFTIKLGDMNVSKVVNSRNLNYTQTGTPYYASPEVWKDEPYDFKSDIWSLGCVLYEMICLKPPF